MLDDIKEFFDRFVRDFSSFDGALIASRYQAPYLAVTSDAAVWECAAPSDLVEYFQSLLDKHSAEGVTHTKYESLEVTEIGRSCFLASVTWTMMNDAGDTVSNWRESYNLIKTADGLKIFTSIDH